MTPSTRERALPAYRSKHPKPRPGVHFYDDRGRLHHYGPDMKPQQGRAGQ